MMHNETLVPGPDYQFLKTVPVLKGISEKSLKMLLVNLKKYCFQSGDYIFRQNEKVEMLYILEVGKAEIFKSDINGKKLTLWFVKPGDVFCLANLFAQYSFANALAHGNCLLYGISREKLISILLGDKEFTQRLIGCMSRKVAIYSGLLEDLTFKNMTARLAGLLIRCISLTCSTQGECKITRADMASLLGTRREVISRLLKQFQKDGLIDFVRTGRARYVRIIDENGLKYIIDRVNQESP